MMKLVASESQLKFGQEKYDTWPRHCRDCEVQFACYAPATSGPSGTSIPR